MLTAKQIAALAIPGMYLASRNLYVQVSRTGTKSWIFRYAHNGMTHDMGFGSLELVTLAEARDKALLCRKMLLDGTDPLEERRNKRSQALLTAAGRITFRTCAERYIEAHAAGWRNRKHRIQWANTLNTYAYPVIGDLPVAQCRHRPGAADPRTDLDDEDRNRDPGSRSDRERPGLGDRASLPRGRKPARWRGHLDKLLAARNPRSRRPIITRALPYADMPAFMAELRDRKASPPAAWSSRS